MRGRAPAIPAIPAGTWRAAGGLFRKLRMNPPVPLSAYTGRLTGVPLTGGQASGTMSGAGALTLQAGPQGLGTVWYPAQITLSTSVGVLDTATALVYLGIGGVPTQLIATVYSGNGTVAVAVPPMSPGEFIIVSWTGGTAAATASFNIIGTMDALTTGPGT